jgi:putative ABC transport system permease protein
MDIGEMVREAVQNLLGNKLRSGLTVLGIVIGVAAVIALLSLGQGAQATITGSINSLGSNLVFVFPGNASASSQGQLRNPKPLTMADAQALRDATNAPDVAAVAPEVQAPLTVAFGGNSARVSVYGVTPDYQSVRSYSMLEGSFINNDQVNGRASVALLGTQTADSLFGTHVGLVGQSLRIKGQQFRVIGVLAPKGGTAIGNQDNIVMVPITTEITRLTGGGGQDAVSAIYVQAKDAKSVTPAEQEIKQILRSRHEITSGAPTDFTVSTQSDFLGAASTITNTLTIFLAAIGAISLLVGGIGIMNIMLVSVTERTREIGIRKAVGARKRDILFQFIAESSMLSLLGGIVGILFGIGIAELLGRVAAGSGTPLAPVVTPAVVLGSTLISIIIGLFFGVYPANRAANLQPVEALRYE